MTYPEINVFDTFNDFLEFVTDSNFTSMLTAYRGYLVLITQINESHYDDDVNEYQIFYQYYIIRQNDLKKWFNTPYGAWKSAVREIDRLEDPDKPEFNRPELLYLPDSVIYYGMADYNSDMAKHIYIPEANRRNINDMVNEIKPASEEKGLI